MKLRYFGYYLRKFDTQKKFLFNIKSVVDAFISSSNMELKSSFKRGDDKLYLTKVTGYEHLYYFVRTSDDDLLKRINEQSLTVSDITDKLSANEKVAYASYVYLSPVDCVMACAGSTGCPRFDDFAGYINELFKKVSLDNYEFHVDALTTSNTKADLLKMKMVNSVYVDVAADNPVGKSVAKLLTGKDDSNLGNFRITIEPNGTNLKQTLSDVVTTLKGQSTQGFVNVGAKAKHDELKGQLMDYWLDNESNLTDSLNPKAKTKLEDQITAKYDQNQHLIPLYKAYTNNNSLKAEADALLSTYGDKAQFASKEQNQIDTTQPADNDDGVVVPMNAEASS